MLAFKDQQQIKYFPCISLSFQTEEVNCLSYNEDSNSSNVYEVSIQNGAPHSTPLAEKPAGDKAELASSSSSIACT